MTTNINELPLTNEEKITHDINSSYTQQQTDNNKYHLNNVDISGQNKIMNENTMNELVDGIQKASLFGATELPSRDFPQNTQNFNNDPYKNTNYIPPTSIRNYAEDELKDIQKEQIINNYNKINNFYSKINYFYDNIRIPLIAVLLYFIFQMNCFKSTLYKYVIHLFDKDGNYNLTGLIITSILYGVILHIILCIIKDNN